MYDNARAARRAVPPGITAAGYFRWLVSAERRRVITGATFGTLWMVGLMIPPYLVGEAIDEGVGPHRFGATLAWSGAILASGLVNACLGMMRHRTMSQLRMDSRFRTTKTVLDHVVRLGATFPRKVSAGEVVTIGSVDVSVVSRTLTVTGPGVGAIVAYVVVAFLLMSISVTLAITAIVGVPLVTVVIGPFLGRLRSTETEYRERQGRLTARVGDIVSGLRVISGLGGQPMFAARYRSDSARVRDEGYRAGATASWISALSVGLPALFLALVTWLAARLASAGSITIGDMVTVYGYVAVLVVPVSSMIEGTYDISRGLVAARRIVAVLNLTPDLEDPGADGPAATERHTESQHELFDPESGLVVPAGRVSAVACARGADAVAIFDRLGRYVDSAARWGTTPLSSLPLAEVRDRILVAGNDAEIFSGSLREIVSGRHRDSADAKITEAMRIAHAGDIIDSLPDGLGSHVQARGLNLSGGQRQRLRLARAVLADPEVMLLAEPTSAVDTHTEAEIVARLYAARGERTTVIAGTSPLLLDRAQTVSYVVCGRVVASGSHAELLAAEPGYRALVSRDDSVAEPAEDGVR
jgi:ABC-type multidrug transport system fused ATPase/permease subunit